MKEIGERLKETRESIGITMDEASEDLKIRPSQIEAIEAGNMENFKDIFSLKYFIRDYSKYLGLDYDDMVDEFNEYLFDYTSKISIEDIKEAKKEILAEPKNEEEIVSPYTIEHNKKIRIPTIIIYIVLIIIVIIGGLFIYDNTRNNSRKDSVVMRTLD